MGNKIILLLFLSFILKGCSNNDDSTQPIEPKIEFVKAFGGSLNDVGNSVIKTTDGGYAVFGHTQSSDGDISDKATNDFDYWLLKFDSNDTLQWSKTFGGTNTEQGFKIIATTDGGFALIGFSESNDGDVLENNGWNDVWIVKLNGVGDISWEKSHGFSGSDQGLSIIQTSDGGYFICGVLDVSASGGSGNDKFTNKKHAGGDYWTLKLTANGDKEWRRYFGGTFTDTAFDAVETLDNGFLLIGSSDSNDVDISGNKGGYDFWILKINSSGTMVWEKSFGGSQIDEARSIVKTTDGNFLILGDSRSSDKDVSGSKGAADIWLIKISDSGKLIWDKSYGGSSFDAGRSISSTLDGGFLIAGSSRSQDGDVEINQGQNDAWLIKISNTGNIEWQKTIGGSEIDFAYGITELNNGNIIAVGETSSSDGDLLENHGFTDLLLTKIVVE